MADPTPNPSDTAGWTALPGSDCALGESPFWHPHERALHWLDIPGRQALRTRGDIAGGQAVVERWALPQEPGCMAPARRGGLVIALRDGIYRAREWGGALQCIAAFDHDTATMRFNDGKCDPQGRFWAGTLQEPKDRPIAALYCIDARGGGPARVQKMAGEAITANGLVLVPERGRVYWADTAAHAVRAYDWTDPPHALTGERLFRQFDPKPAGWTPESGVPYDGRPDGATLDRDGRYWVAMFEGGQLQALDAEGRTLERLPVPARCPTMPCFGGDDLCTLFVTTARKGRPAAELARQPMAGQVLWRRMAAPGRPVAFFED
ncbi:SMP-30/gluconolactonase/LRE family protein [uncultured Pseudacidovorax sp.]|uniref:SMP-30/gluconolactonase/LRE family protein n=1 Tax=uncultured Pseudacidovorax sp. TaxID=679313 RepID=UPI0025DE6008|nr:SMP-30/gluconolactonase/LRE family protein [uncultured Pseudacidovorax sp.]